jgi:Protein of unknown function (DUF1064)
MKTSEAAGIYKRLGLKLPADIAAPDASKYRNVKKSLDGHVFDSTLEANVYTLLKHWERSGLITNLVLQPRFLLQEGFTDSDGKAHRKIEYVADFRFTDLTDMNLRDRVIDAKGVVSRVFVVKYKLFKARYPDLRLELWTKATLKELS